MAAEKSLALVLRLVDFSETSVVVTLFTREFGKLSALAKGARRPKGPFESALDLLALVRIVFLPKSPETLALLTEAKLERRFRAASRNLACLYAAYYVAELLNELTHDGDPHPELFDAACRTLEALDQLGASEGADTHVAQHVLRFEMDALRLLGHMPALDLCVECGAQPRGGGRVAFGMLAGGVLCAKCRSGKPQVVSLSAAAVDLWRTLAGESSNTKTDLERRTYGEVRGALNHYLANLLGHRPRMHDYLGLLAGSL